MLESEWILVLTVVVPSTDANYGLHIYAKIWNLIPLSWYEKLKKNDFIWHRKDC